MSEVIPHWLTRQAYLAPDQTAVELVDGTEISFLELKDRSQSFARKLLQLNVRKGSKVGLLSANHIDMVIAIHALSYIGATAVMLNIRLTKKELDYQLNDAGVSLVLTQTNEPKIESGFTFSEVWKLSESTGELETEIDLSAVFTIIYTSGTTGFPKGVIHTYGNHWWSAVGSMLNLGLEKNDKWLVALPMFHVSGLSIVIRSVLYGIPLYLLEKYDKQDVHEAIMAKGVTIMSVVTVMLHDLVGMAYDSRYPETFRCALLGGGPAPKSLLEKAKLRDVPVFQSYGMTETSSQIVTLSPRDALRKLGSSGKPLFPAQLQIKTTGNDDIGDIYVKGPMVTEGYFQNDKATNQSITDGWLATGDLGYTDEEGFLYVVDRRKDLIISGGENIYPTEIEGALTKMAGIQEAGVVGIEDDKWGQIPVAFIVTHDETIDSDAVMDFARYHLAGYKLPGDIYFINELPRNASRKLVRNQLKAYIKS